ncbi:MAG: hypothetical protein FWF12_02010 [Betaproteobacteria bacterium]|nr:hypothetical protein [Betaproteobacteria bacterium]
MVALAALVAVPIISVLINGFGMETEIFIVDRLLLIFGILFFGIIFYAGIIDPVIGCMNAIIDRILCIAETSLARIFVCSALLPLLIPHRHRTDRHRTCQKGACLERNSSRR